MKSSIFSKIPFSNIMLAFALLSAAALSAPAQTLPCVETNGVKFLLPPNIDGGLDVKDSRDNIVLADDFSCNTTGPITDIHLWGSWLSDIHGTITNFWIGIYNDVPAVTNFSGQVTPSHPGNNLLWQQSFVLGQYVESQYATGSEYFYNPTNNLIVGGDSQAWYYCFYPTNPFMQQGTAANPTNYWLAVRAQISDQTPTALFGWKTSLIPYNDAAVWGTVLPTSGLPIGNWQSMINPLTLKQIDLSFKLTTPTNQPPPTVCVETNGVKYIQGPNTLGGYDVWNTPYVLADDFVCTNIGPISDIHIWGSWLNDQAFPTNITFWLGIYDNVPVDPGNAFSHPGTNLLWQQWFTPGQHAETIWTANASEQFLDPGQPASGPQIIGSDSVVWYYCFYPTNPFVQQGSTANSKTYWLAAYAQLPVGGNYNYGWKTTTNVQHDISVHAPWPGFGPTNNPGWAKTLLPAGAPLDLAFKLTTPTNGCPVNIVCSLDKTVECGSTWSFDPPNIGPDPCCPTNPTVLFGTVTNILGPCNQIIIRTWFIMDSCSGATLGVCTQKVTVVDTTPPVITCASNKIVECGSAWTFGQPTAVDACCGTNVTITVISTITNSPSCPQIITRTWRATDCCTNSSPCSQTVTVVDTTPPTIFCSSNIVVSTCNTNTIVTWSITATDTCSSVTVTSTPPSGSVFLSNSTNTVVATATDGCDNTKTCSFTVAVVRPVFGPIFINYLATNKVVLTWTNGFLQVSTNVIGPYANVPGATSPYTNTTVAPPPYKFYRLRCN